MRGYHRPIRLSDLELDLDPSQDLHDLPSSRPLTTTRSANNAATTRSGGALFVPPPVPGVPTNRQSGGQQRPAGPSDPCPIINSKNDDARFIAEGQADGIQGRPRVLQHQLPSVSSLGLQDTDLDPPPPPLAQKLAQDKHDQSASLVSLPSDQGDAQPPLLGDRTRRWSDSTGQGTGNHNKNLSVNPLAQREAVRHSTGSRLSPIPTSPQHDWRHRPEQRSSSRDPALHRTSLLLLPPMEKLKNVGRFRRTPKETNQPESRHAQPQKKPFIKLTGLFSRTHQAKFGPPKQFQSSSDTSAGQYLAPVASSPDSRIASSSISSIENHERSISLPDRRNNIHARRAPPEGYFAHESPETFSVARPHQHIRSASSPDRTRLSDPYPVDPRRLSPQSPPYHSSATPQRQPRATSPRHSSPLPSPRTPPSRGRSEDRTYAQELHLRSRSPKAFAPRPEERNLPKHDPTDPAYKLGTFRSSNPRTSRVGDQELPWKITIPGDTEEATANTSASWRRETEGVLNGTRLPTYQEDVEEHGTLQRTPDEKRAPLFPDPPTVPDEPIPSQTNPTSPNHPHRSGARAINSLETPVELPVRTDDNSSEEIMMSSTAYPGQEWRPLGFSEWEHQ
ncbi:hypothetical protein BJY04DRAFT_170760 [Aspergillus karnatakaensis]|uniref:uncharacterized protein n=1 Tax=Aspergillus karnatakaensis TaxID=1810916 RepID=UPI003CCC9E2D